MSWNVPWMDLIYVLSWSTFVTYRCWNVRSLAMAWWALASSGDVSSAFLYNPFASSTCPTVARTRPRRTRAGASDGDLSRACLSSASAWSKLRRFCSYVCCEGEREGGEEGAEIEMRDIWGIERQRDRKLDYRAVSSFSSTATKEAPSKFLKYNHGHTASD